MGNATKERGVRVRHAGVAAASATGHARYRHRSPSLLFCFVMMMRLGRSVMHSAQKQAHKQPLRRSAAASAATVRAGQAAARRALPEERKGGRQ